MEAYTTDPNMWAWISAWNIYIFLRILVGYTMQVSTARKRKERKNVESSEAREGI